MPEIEIESGYVATCGMVEVEVLYSARSPAEYAPARAAADGFEWLAMPDEVWQRALEVRHAWLMQACTRGVALPDLLIAATAERHRVPVVHYDHGYELIASITGQPMRWVVPRGAWRADAE